MKKITAAVAAILLAAGCSPRISQNIPSAPVSRISDAPYSHFSEGMLGSIRPEGWLRECLQRQANGLTGHPKALSYPYNTCLWAGRISRSGSHGSDWWRYEQTAYYTDGLLRLGYALRDTALVAMGEAGVRHTLAGATPQGLLGISSHYMLEGDDYSQWPFAVFFRAMQAQYQATGDERIPAALEKHFLQFPVSSYRSRSAVNIEGMLWTYGITRNPALLELAEKAWAQGNLYLNQQMCLSQEKLYEHGVTLCEFLKLPIILYSYTGKEIYKQAALNAQKKLEDLNILPDGVISSAEHVLGQDPLASHETCDIADYTWSLGYFLMATGESKWADKIEKAVLNAGFGCVTKDFKQLQYFSSVNQFIATGTSNHNEFMRGRTWMAYRPTHQTECCAGNVHRIFPNYLARMWMHGKSKDSAVAALYGPSTVSFELSDGTVCTITEDTQYPFGDDVTFVFHFTKGGAPVRSHELEFSFRLPEGCTAAEPYEFGDSGFATIAKKFRSGETLALHFNAEPLLKQTQGGCYVQRGELVYSLAIPANVEVDNTVYSYMNGKAPDEPGFDCLNLTPAGNCWQWALKVDTELKFVRSDIAPVGAYPWESSPISIDVPALPISGWDLVDGQFTPPVPAVPALTGAPARTLTLVPYGTTLLRLTVFPVAE